MATAYIVDAVRTAGGRRGGKLAGVHPVDLGAAVFDAIADRNNFDTSAIDDVITGCVSQGGQQTMDLGRNAVLASKLPDSIPAVTIDRQCGSSQQAMMFAAQAVMSGTQDIVLASGIESMTRVPMGSVATLFMKEGLGNYKSPRLEEKFPGIMFSQFAGAEMIVKKHGFTKDDLDAFALASHQRAKAATEAGHFKNEVVGIEVETPEGKEVHLVDEGIRFDATLESISSVKLLQEGGSITAATSSQICDGASAVLIVSEQALKDHGLTPRARIHHISVRAADPIWHLTAPIPATEYALKKAGMSIKDIDLVEINEAFASQSLACVRELGLDMAKVNLDGGALALGHPLGATGARITGKAASLLQRTGGRYAIATQCIAGGQGVATLLEAV